MTLNTKQLLDQVREKFDLKTLNHAGEMAGMSFGHVSHINQGIRSEPYHDLLFALLANEVAEIDITFSEPLEITRRYIELFLKIRKEAE